MKAMDLNCKPFKIVPKVSSCVEDLCTELSLCRMPRVYPSKILESTLQTAYTFNYEADFENALHIKPDVYKLPIDETNSDYGSIEILDAEDVCEATDSESILYYNYINPINKQEKLIKRDSLWVLNYLDRICNLGTTGITKGPAYVSLFNAIQEIIQPPTISPGSPRKGTKLPKPEGDCPQGVWVLAYINDEFTWICDETDNKAAIECDKFLYLRARLLTGDKKIDGGDVWDGVEENIVLTAATISNIKIPKVEVSWAYTGVAMPPINIKLRLENTVNELDSNLIARANWLNTKSTIATAVIGPAYYTGDMSSNSETGEALPIIKGFSHFEFEYDWVECYKPLAAQGNYEPTNIICRVEVPACPDLQVAEQGFTVTCADALGTIGITDIVLHSEDNEFRESLGDGDSFTLGKICREVTSGTYFLTVYYENKEKSTYIASKKIQGVVVAKGDDGTEGEEGDKKSEIKVNVFDEYAPDRLEPATGDEEPGVAIKDYKFNFSMPEGVCQGEIVLNVILLNYETDANSLEGDRTEKITEIPVRIKLNEDCEQCPTFVTTSAKLVDTITGESVESWTLSCNQGATSRRISYVLSIKSSDEFADYINTDKTTITVLPVINGEGISFLEKEGVTHVVPNVSIGAEATMSFDFVVSLEDFKGIFTKEDTDPSKPICSATFTPTINKKDEVGGGNEGGTENPETANVSKVMNIIKPCGALQISKVYLLNADHMPITSIEDCEAGRAYLVMLGVDFINESAKFSYNNNLKMTTTITLEGDLKLTEEGAPTTIETFRKIDIDPMGTTSIRLPYFIFRVGTELTGSITISVNIPDEELTESATMNINELCGSSSSSSNICDGDPNCCRYVESADDKIEVGFNPETGRCTLKLKEEKGPYYAGDGINIEKDGAISVLVGNLLEIDTENRVSVKMDALTNKIQDVIEQWLESRTRKCN